MKTFQISLGVCAVILVLSVSGIDSANAQVSTSLSFSPSDVTMYVGESKTIYISGGGSYYLGANSNPSVASAVLSGSSVKIDAYTPGTDSVSVCSYLNGGVSCSAVAITVLKQVDTQQQQQNAQHATISFSKMEVNLNVGQVEKVTVYGSATGAYYISGYGSDSVSASIDGNVVTLTGSRVGGSNVSVCQFGGTCGNVYGFVPNTSSNATAQQAVPTIVPILSAFYVASNNLGGEFLGKGSALTFKFNTNDNVVSQSLRVNGQAVAVNGSVTGASSGPFGGTYTMTGNETLPLTVYIGFTSAQGLTGHSSFTIGEKAGTASPTASTPASTPVSTQSSSSGSGKFSRNLQSGSTGTDVLVLQTLLKRLGLYSGPVTGTYGLQTTAAVQKYQAKNKLSQVGVVGPATRELLNKEP